MAYIWWRWSNEIYVDQAPWKKPVELKLMQHLVHAAFVGFYGFSSKAS